MDSLVNHMAPESRASRLPGGHLVRPPLITLITQGSLVWSLGTYVRPDAELMLEAEHQVGIYTC